MTMIFLGGSRDVVELPVAAIERIGAIVAAEHGVLIGDAPGADAEMQGLLAGYSYEHVGVFHAHVEPRNNLGDWAAYHVPPPAGAKGFAVHAAKDREMAGRADFGLMVWDGVSPGTCLNMLRLAVIGSPCVVYDTMRGTVGTVQTVADWHAMLRHAGPDVRRDVEARMTAQAASHWRIDRDRAARAARLDPAEGRPGSRRSAPGSSSKLTLAKRPLAARQFSGTSCLSGAPGAGRLRIRQRGPDCTLDRQIPRPCWS